MYSIVMSTTLEIKFTSFEQERKYIAKFNHSIKMLLTWEIFFITGLVDYVKQFISGVIDNGEVCIQFRTPSGISDSKFENRYPGLKVNNSCEKAEVKSCIIP